MKLLSRVSAHCLGALPLLLGLCGAVCLADGSGLLQSLKQLWLRVAEDLECVSVVLVASVMQLARTNTWFAS